MGTGTGRVRQDSANVRQSFNSLSEFIDYASEKSPMSAGARKSRTNSEGFTNSRDWAHALELSTGWYDGAARIQAMSVRIKPKGIKARKAVMMRECGPGTLAMGAFTAGHPQPYAVLVDTDRVKRGKGKIVRLLVSSNASGMVDADVLEARGAAICALVNALESAGHRVEIDLCGHVTNSSPAASLCYVTRLKHADHRLNLPTVAFALAHPSMLRRIGFSAYETEGELIRKRIVANGYGRPTDAPQELQDRASIYIGRTLGSEPQWHSEKRATEWVLARLADQGVTLA